MMIASGVPSTASSTPTSRPWLSTSRAHAVSEFGVSLDELHNDSTTVTFHGA